MRVWVVVQVTYAEVMIQQYLIAYLSIFICRRMVYELVV
jgi:hypothetical protein